MGTKQPLQLNLICLALAISLLLFQPACKGSTTPDPPDPPTQYQHALTVNALTLHTDSAVTGTVQVTMRSSGQIYTGSIGQKIALATTTKQEEACDILITATGCLPRGFTEVAVKDSTLTTNLVAMSAMDWDFFFYIVTDGKNRSWVPRKFEVYFNPDPLTGLRLDPGYVNAIEQALLYIQQNSKGWIQSVNFYELGNKPLDPSVPPEGEIWIHRRSDVPGIGNITYPAPSDVKVLSSRIFVNQDDIPAALPAETYDALFAGEQQMGNNPSQIGPFYMMMLNRPRDTNSYVISTQKETQKGVDSQTTFTSVTAQVNTDTLSPANTVGSYNTIPSRTGTTRPAPKERIRN
jgi:hypothetical protein